MSEEPCERALQNVHGPALPLWRLAPTRDGDGRCVADFMMLIPGLRRYPEVRQRDVAAQIRAACAGYGDQVVFADINVAINVLWVSVAAEPGLVGRVAQSIRDRVPEALLVGGQLGTAAGLAPSRAQASPIWLHLRRLSRRISLRLSGPRR
ncbi:MAG: hypothetical protein KDJ27_14765 [Gammaproteobacteria bacterium]|nr:hypothetical protein [Gammaproteobacteria bacterium]